MIDRMPMPISPTRAARATGALYLSTHVTSVGAAAAYAAATTPLGIRFGVTLEFALALGCAVTGILVFALFRGYGEVRAASFALLRLLEAAVILAGTVPMIVLAWNWADAQAHSQLIQLHQGSFLVGQGLVIAVNTIILGSLLVASDLVPRALGWLGIAGGIIVLAGNFAQLFELIPFAGPVAGLAAIPIFAFELWFAVTLLVARRFPARATLESRNTPF